MHIVPSVAALSILSSLAYGQAPKVCNNAAALCEQSYGNITYLGAHDSFSVRNSSNDYSVAADQVYNTIQQLDAGVRLVTGQVHLSSGPAVGNTAVTNLASGVGSNIETTGQGAIDGISSTASSLGRKLGIGKRQAPNDNLQEWRLCHSNCLLYDGGSLVDWLSSIKSWLDRNPNDVLTILLVNSDNADAGTLNNIFTTSGIAQYAYQPASTTTPPQQWPTLNDMIAQNKRLVVFIASLDPTSNTVAPYLLDEFTFVWENPYDNVQPSDFSCLPDRPSQLKGNLPTALSSGMLPLMNHFRYDNNSGIEIPSVENVPTTNGVAGSGLGNLGDTANNCTSQWKRAPSYVLVDFFNVGDALATVDALNGVAAPGQTQGRLLLPDTVDASQAQPSPSSYESGATATGGTVSAQAMGSQPTSGAGRLKGSLGLLVGIMSVMIVFA